MEETLVIPMGDHRPAEITVKDWPVLAVLDKHRVWPDGGATDWNITVRQHHDGRVLVYGSFVYEDKKVTEYDVRYGELIIDAGFTETAIRSVAKSLKNRVSCLVQSYYSFDELACECIAKLPPEKL